MFYNFIFLDLIIDYFLLFVFIIILVILFIFENNKNKIIYFLFII